MGYANLKRVFEPEVREVPGPRTGTQYTVETQSFFDDPRQIGGDLRVMVSIDDGRGYRALVPLTESFIIAPDGTFVRE
jgi:hypothetical protein